MGRMPESVHHRGGLALSAQLVKDLIDAGVHFGHRASRWNPKMKPYIFGKRNLIHVINVKETVKGILLAKRFLNRVVAEGQDILWVGTKRQARRAIERAAERTSMHYVTERWLGGTLTNFHEIRKRIGRLEELEKLEAEGMMDMYSKKEGASLRRELSKIRRNLGGIRNMTRHPGALVVVDQKREIIAIREAQKTHIPVVCLLDTDCDPDLVNIAIPGNDDAMKAIELIVREMGDAAEMGAKARDEQVQQAGETTGQQRRRSRRATTARAEESTETPAEDQASGEAASAPDQASPEKQTDQEKANTPPKPETSATASEPPSAEQAQDEAKAPPAPPAPAPAPAPAESNQNTTES
jgi:small subunit ribosomal protein S2